MDKNLIKLAKILISEQIALCLSGLLWTSSCFLQVNQQRLVGMVSTNNM